MNSNKIMSNSRFLLVKNNIAQLPSTNFHLGSQTRTETVTTCFRNVLWCVITVKLILRIIRNSGDCIKMFDNEQVDT